jgi:hypothetical protein
VSGQPAVLQVVILRDGLLVGTEVFVPGQYTLGSGLGVDLRLDDATVHPAHAYLYFQNGRAAIQDAGSGAVFVNGHRVNACEVRAVDEIILGPFTLKVRVMAQRPQARPSAPPEVAAILSAPSPVPAPAPAPAPAPVRPPPRASVAPAQPRQQPPATVVSNRRMTAVPAVPEPVHARHLRPVPSEDAQETQSLDLGGPFFDEPVRSPSPAPTFAAEGAMSARDAARKLSGPAVVPSPVPSTPSPVPSTPSPIPSAPAARPRSSAPAAAAAKPAKPPAAARQSRRMLPSVPSPAGSKGRPHLFVELYWGETRKVAQSYAVLEKKQLIAREDDVAPLPLWGFSLEEDFVFAEQKDDLFRVYVPPGAAVERRAQDGNFYPVKTDTLELGDGQRRCVTLGTGHAMRLSSEADVTVVVYVQPALPKPFVNPLRGLPWLMLVNLALAMSAFFSFAILYSDPVDNADFQSKGLTPVAVKLIAPPKPEVKKKLEEKVEKLVKKVEKKKEQPKSEKPKVSAEAKRVLKTVEKLTAAGPAMKDLLAAVDKLGSGPGSKNAKNDFKLSGLIGKQPIANAGIGSFGLGGGGGGGSGIKGLEMLRGKGGGGIGALGSGNIGKGSVAGTVTHAVSRNVGAQGTIDKEAVAKVINSHLHEVSSCYERALLKTPGLAGKIVLEWQITTAGAVGFAKTKSSTMQSPAVESCILTALKAWRFPPAKGAGVLITYPFMFNSVGY